MKKGAGILLHISSLPSAYGIGSLGSEARNFVDSLACAGIKYWQVLPLSPTGYGDSPYQSCSADAGNPYFIDLETLYAEGLLTQGELDAERYQSERVDYERLFYTREKALKLAFDRDADSSGFQKFLKTSQAKEYALYMALKAKFGYRPWSEWPEEYRLKNPAAMKAVKAEQAREIEFWRYTQYKFFVQWAELKRYAEKKGIAIIGDIPIYVAYDSAEVWLHPDLFLLDKKRKPRLVAGVPPDCFTDKGQLWGNPLYDWAYMKEDGYRWWKARIKASLKVYTYMRIDHFRGFDRFYTVKYGSPDAKIGVWKKGPGWSLFKDLTQYNIIAEDLGFMEESVRVLLKKTGYPGMKILLFAFDGHEDNEHKPSNYTPNYIAYTGTHDNEPLISFIKSALDERPKVYLDDLRRELSLCGKTLATDDVDTVADGVMELLFCSPADVVILPVQDLLHLDKDCRMNLPSTVSTDNWSFRLRDGQFGGAAVEKLAALVKEGNRG